MVLCLASQHIQLMRCHWPIANNKQGIGLCDWLTGNYGFDTAEKVGVAANVAMRSWGSKGFTITTLVNKNYTCNMLLTTDYLHMTCLLKPPKEGMQ